MISLPATQKHPEDALKQVAGVSCGMFSSTENNENLMKFRIGKK
jgi:hypothetical protein